jgi:hypothetical protein
MSGGTRDDGEGYGRCPGTGRVSVCHFDPGGILIIICFSRNSKDGNNAEAKRSWDTMQNMRDGYFRSHPAAAAAA